MISIAVDKSILELQKALGDAAPKKLRREVSTAVNYVAKQAKNGLAKEIAKELATTQTTIKQSIAVSKKSTPETLSATVTQDETKRIPLKEFKARQTKAGVRYKISKTSGQGFIKSAFISPQLGNHVFQRTGKSRLPIDKKYGPSPWGVTVKKRLDKLIAARDLEPLLIKQIERRIKAVNFKKTQG